jgi:hypothetical protein
MLTSCSIAPPVPAGDYRTKLSFRETALLLDAQARKCWTDKANMLSDGVLIESKITIQNTAQISAIRYGGNIGVSNTFVVVDVIPAPNGAFVKVAEGDYEIGWAGTNRNKFGPDVNRWISGDTACHAP